MPIDFNEIRNESEKDAVYVVEQMLTQYPFDEDEVRKQFDDISKNASVLVSKIDDDFLLDHQKVMFDYVTLYKHTNICSVPGVRADYTVEDILIDLYNFVVSDIMKKYYDTLFLFINDFWK